MAAPEGNQFWKLRSKHGRDKLFATPELMWEAACEYFEWCDSNPWMSEKLKTKESGTETEVAPTQRPYTLSGLCLYLDCSQGYFRTFKTDKEKCTKEFLAVITRIEEVIETQQYEGAAVGAYNANIVARKLGLADKQESKSEVETKATIKIVPMEGAKQTFASSESDVDE